MGPTGCFPLEESSKELQAGTAKNLAISGTIDTQQLLLLLQNGEWKVNRLEGAGAISVCRFIDDKRLLFLRSAGRGTSRSDVV